MKTTLWISVILALVISHTASANAFEQKAFQEMKTTFLENYQQTRQNSERLRDCAKRSQTSAAMQRCVALVETSDHRMRTQLQRKSNPIAAALVPPLPQISFDGYTWNEQQRKQVIREINSELAQMDKMHRCMQRSKAANNFSSCSR